jgi:hypothetical protein
MFDVTISTNTITPEEESIRRLGREATAAAKTDIMTAIELLKAARALARSTRSYQSIDWWARLGAYYARAGKFAACEAEFNRLEARIPALAKKAAGKRSADALKAQEHSDYAKFYRAKAAAYKRMKRPEVEAFLLMADDHAAVCKALRDEIEQARREAFELHRAARLSRQQLF